MHLRQGGVFRFLRQNAARLALRSYQPYSTDTEEVARIGDIHALPRLWCKRVGSSGGGTACLVRDVVRPREDYAILAVYRVGALGTQLVLAPRPLEPPVAVARDLSPLTPRTPVTGALPRAGPLLLPERPVVAAADGMLPRPIPLAPPVVDAVLDVVVPRIRVPLELSPRTPEQHGPSQSELSKSQTEVAAL